MKKYSLYIVVSSSLMILFCIIYQATYAYYFVDLQDTRGGADATSSTFNTAQLSNLTMVSTSSNGVSNLIPGESVTATFQIENPGNAKMCFDLLWTDVVNEFTNTGDLLVTLKDSTDTVLYNGVFPTTDSILLAGLSINGNKTENYTIVVTYQNRTESQIIDMGKNFGAKISGQLTNCTNP